MSSVKHPGVTVLKANNQHPRRARWTDPDTGRKRVHALPHEPAEAEKWLLRKSAELMLRRARSDRPGAGLALPLVIEKYMLEIHRRAEGTRKQYGYTLRKFETFAKDKPITVALLRQWRSSLDQPGVAVASVNRDLSHLSAFLNHARLAGDIVILKDTIADGLKRLPGDHEKKEAFTYEEIADLLRRLLGAPALYRDFVIVTLLTGMRASEVLRLSKSQVQLPHDRIQLGRETKTKRGRMIDLSISPTVASVLRGFDGWGFTANQVRYLRELWHPMYTFQRMRVTCGTFLTCSPGIYGGASAAMSAMRLGHSIEVAQRHYVGQVIVDRDARTLEAAMRITSLMASLR